MRTVTDRPAPRLRTAGRNLVRRARRLTAGRRAAGGVVPTPPLPPIGPVPPLPRVRSGLAGALQQRRLGRQAKGAGKVAHDGDARTEATTAATLRRVEAHLVAAYRYDGGIRAATLTLGAAEGELAAALDTVGVVEERTQTPIADALGVAADDVAQQVAWTAGSQARAERARAQDGVTAARRAHTVATTALQEAGRGAVDRLLIAAETGVDAANAYLTLYDRARARRGRPPVGLLERDVAEELVRRALRPVDLDPPDAAPAADPAPRPVTPPSTAHLHVA